MYAFDVAVVHRLQTSKVAVTPVSVYVYIALPNWYIATNRVVFSNGAAGRTLASFRLVCLCGYRNYFSTHVYAKHVVNAISAAQ